MKIFSAGQIKEWERSAVAEQNISFHELMERAAHACFSWIEENYYTTQPFYIFCGNGNNAGDGLALARMLIESGYTANVVLLNDKNIFSDDAAMNLKTFRKYFSESILAWDELFDLKQISSGAIIVDAVFGTGLNRAVEGKNIAQIQALNQLTNTKISIDIPSGLFTDSLQNADAVCFSADYTLSFQSYKRSFLHSEAAKYIGEIILLNIDLSKEFELKTETNFYTVDEKFIQSIYKKRNPYSHKGTFGTAVLVGGSYGKIGAIALSAKAALRAGAGKVFVQSPECGYNILQILAPEAMFDSAGKNFVEKIQIAENAVIGMGPGFGTHEVSAKAVHDFLKSYKKPLVIDADALNIIALNKEKLLPLIPPNSILTPHPKEFERLFGKTDNSLEQTNLAMQKAVAHQIVIVLKGHRTAVCTPTGKCFYNLTGNAGMATGGSGDVLTGIVTALLAQGYSSENAALLGVYMHGFSGDIAAAKNSQEALIAGDLIEYLGSAFSGMNKNLIE